MRSTTRLSLLAFCWAGIAWGFCAAGPPDSCAPALAPSSSSDAFTQYFREAGRLQLALRLEHYRVSAAAGGAVRNSPPLKRELRTIAYPKESARAA